MFMIWGYSLQPEMSPNPQNINLCCVFMQVYMVELFCPFTYWMGRMALAKALGSTASNGVHMITLGERPSRKKYTCREVSALPF